MKGFITVTITKNGEIANLYISPEKISYFAERGSQTFIKLDNGEELVIEESLQKIQEIVQSSLNLQHPSLTL